MQFNALCYYYNLKVFTAIIQLLFYSQGLSFLALNQEHIFSTEFGAM
jgi:hypothetical protein